MTCDGRRRASSAGRGGTRCRPPRCPPRSSPMSERRDGRRGPTLLRESIAQAHDVRRPVRRLPLGRRRLVDERRPHGRADRRAGAAPTRRRSRTTRRYNELAVRPRRRAALRHRPPRGPDRRHDLRRLPAGARLPPGRADRRLGLRAAALRRRSSRATPARSSSRSARAPTSSSTATTALRRPPPRSWCPSSARCPSNPRPGRRSPRAPAARRRAGRPPRRGALRRRPQPRPVLGRRHCASAAR